MADCNLGDDHADYLPAPPDHGRCMHSANDARQFNGYPFRRDLLQLFRTFFHCLKSLVFYLKSEARGKPHGAEYAQCIFAETFLRIADSPYDALFKIADAAGDVLYASVFFHIEGIDRKVPSPDVFFNAAGKRYLVGTPEIRIISVHAERSNLDVALIRDGSNRSVDAGVIYVSDARFFQYFDRFIGVT